jgi:hypothetical protein
MPSNELWYAQNYHYLDKAGKLIAERLYRHSEDEPLSNVVERMNQVASGVSPVEYNKEKDNK